MGYIREIKEIIRGYTFGDTREEYLERLEGYSRGFLKIYSRNHSRKYKIFEVRKKISREVPRKVL